MTNAMTTQHAQLITISTPSGNYQITPDGAVMPLIEGDHTFFHKAPLIWERVIKYLPITLLSGIGVACAMILAYYSILSTNPIAAEGAAYLYVEIGSLFTYLFGGLFLMICLYAANIIISLSRKPAPANTDIVLNDITIVRQESEHDSEQYKTDLANALTLLHTGAIRTVIACKHKAPGIGVWTIQRGKMATNIIDRVTPNPAYELPITGGVITTEAFADYQAYCDACLPLVEQRLLRTRFTDHDAGAQPVALDFLKQHMATVLTIFLSLTATLTMAQSTKSQEAQQYLGHRYTTERPTGLVQFKYESMNINRRCDGTKTWQQALTTEPRYLDQSAGPLKNIIVVTPEGKAVNIAPVNTAAPIDPVRPRPLFDEPASQPTQWDSATVATQLQAYRTQTDGMVREVERQARPIWDSVMYFVNSILSWIVLIMAICWFGAKFGAAESGISIEHAVIIGPIAIKVQQFFAGVLFLLVLFSGIIVIVNIYDFIYRSQISGVFRVISFAAAVYGVYLVSEWLVPNLKILSSRGISNR